MRRNPTMPKYRMIPALALAIALPLCVWAQTPAPTAPKPQAPSAPPTPAEETIDAAVKKLQGLKTVAADLLQSVDMLGQKFRLKGRYLKGAGRQVYLLLSL